MIFNFGQVEVKTKSSEVIRGFLTSYEDVREIMKEGASDLVNVFDLTKNKGVYINTGKKISFINHDEIKTMKVYQNKVIFRR